ncbi:hydroxymethylbilane synthase [Rhodospirillum centenum]|uniref:Porphobilinogen deaminase n=1 Tax=Rhodospirillum centenum (strain ATCC 51521 / SW) TaxID=414684 RepID=B6IPP7_RHOCS|nr:hydroxymethylbilane synthase [Rhodospirillum centenum]ACI99749.1 porphobilinogen deaminase [Rhodospirillum centenum SW]
MKQPLRIGTRGSPLALAQAHETRRRLAEAHPHLAEPDAIEIVVIKTTGDRILDRTLMEAGGKGLFTKEIEEALQAETIDLAVHSMKDVPTWRQTGLQLTAMLPREDPRDAWFCRHGCGLDELPAGAVVGTASLRRQAQILARRPDLKVVPFRGNVQTRMTKLAEGQVDATLLALAGLRRLGLVEHMTAAIETDVMLPAVAQGAIGIETRAADDVTNALVAALNHAETMTRVTAERGVLATLDGSCRTPIAALAELPGDGSLTLSALVIRPNGQEFYRTERRGDPDDAEAMGIDAGQELKAKLPPDFFAVSGAIEGPAGPGSAI